MKFKFNHMYALASSMGKSHQSIEQFYVKFNNIVFDCIFDVGTTPFELMIGAKANNFAYVLKIEKGFIVESPDSFYRQLAKILNLNFKDNGFSTSRFLSYIDANLPKVCSNKLVEPSHLVPFRKEKLSKKNREEGFIFCGWQPHECRNNGHLSEENANKTEALLGKETANFCRKHDISSKWTNDVSKAMKLTKPELI